MENNRNLFLSLLKYKPLENKTPLENFITEAFVFLLSWSLETERKIFNEFLKLLGISITNSNKIELYTQKSFKCGDTVAIPDILIKIDSEFHFIEVKVFSEFNLYTEEKENEEEKVINQIEKYEKIILPSKKYIYSLTVNPPNIEFQTKSFIKSITWQDISNLFASADCESGLKKMLNNFNELLIKNNMVFSKVSKELILGINELLSFHNQLGIVLSEINYPKKQSNSIGYIGYYVDIKNPGIRLWIGINLKYPEYIKIQIVNKELLQRFSKLNRDMYKEDPVNNKCYLASTYEFEENCYFELDGIKQKEELFSWINSEIFKLVEFVNRIGSGFSLKE